MHSSSLQAKPSTDNAKLMIATSNNTKLFTLVSADEEKISVPDDAAQLNIKYILDQEQRDSDEPFNVDVVKGDILGKAVEWTTHFVHHPSEHNDSADRNTPISE